MGLSMTDREELEAMNKINRLEVKDYTDEESIHIKFIDEFKKELHLSINDDIEQSLHDELAKLGWTPPKKENFMTDREELEAMNKINRLEVIDQTGRAYVHYLSEKESVRYSLQDDNRTLKIFIDKYGSVARDDA